MKQLEVISEALGTSERTLRRSVKNGLVKGTCKVRETRIAPTEEAYLYSHWQLLSRLRQELRTQAKVRLAVVYGSFARGDDHQESDLDLYVVTRGDYTYRAILAERLEHVLGRKMQLVEFDPGEDALMLYEIVKDGRPIIDRDELWSHLIERKDELTRYTEEELARQREAAARAYREIAGVAS